MSHLLLTGSTGLLGGYLLRDLLLAGEQVATIVRPGRAQDVETRIEAVLQPFERQLGRQLSRPVVFAGDLGKPWLGLGEAQISWLKSNCDRVLHSAASLAFQDADGEPRRSNVEGVKNVLALCERAGIRRLSHVSTAYVSGMRTGKILESELDEGQQFANIYEETKAEGEQLVRQAKCLDAFTIFRPSIIVGDSKSGYTSTFHGLYAPLRVLQALWSTVTVDQLLEVDYLTALGMNGNERKNLIPVDWASEAIVRISQRETQHGETYALTSPHPPLVSDLTATFEMVLKEHLAETSAALAANPTATSANGSKTKREPAETGAFEDKFLEYFAVYESYWRDDPEFDSTNTQRLLPDLPCPRIDVPALAMLSRFALEANFGYPPVLPQLAKFRIAEWLCRGVACSLDRPLSIPLFSLIGSGPGGGVWTIGATPNRDWCAKPGLDPDVPWVRARATVIGELATLEASFDEVSERGQLATSFHPLQQQQFEELIAHLQSASSNAGANRAEESENISVA